RRGVRNVRAPPPPLRGQYRLHGTPRAARHALLRHVARRPPAGDDRIREPSLVHRRAIPPRAQVAAFCPAPAVCFVRGRCRRAEPAGIISRGRLRLCPVQPPCYLVDTRGAFREMAGDVTRAEFEARMVVLEGEVEGEKMVTRHILDQTRHNSDDLAAIKTRLDRVEGTLDGVSQDVRGLKATVEGLVRNLPAIVAEAVRSALPRRRGKRG